MVFYKTKDKNTLFRAKFPLAITENKKINNETDYIQELERQICEKEDRIRYEVEQWYNYWIPQRLMWKRRALKAESELAMYKEYFEKAKKLTNKDLKKEIDKSSKHDVGSKAWRDYWSAVFKRKP